MTNNNLDFQIVRWNQETLFIYKSTITESYFETTQYLMRNVKLCCKVYPMYIYDLINPVIINNFTYFLHQNILCLLSCLQKLFKDIKVQWLPFLNLNRMHKFMNAFCSNQDIGSFLCASILYTAENNYFNIEKVQ